MELIPHAGARALRFGMDEAAVRAVLGEPRQRVVLDADRTSLGFAGEVDVVLHAEHGLVSITLGAPPAELFGADLFALDAGALQDVLAPHADAAEWRQTDADTHTLSAPSLGLFVYYDADGGRPESVELVSGSWHRGNRIG